MKFTKGDSVVSLDKLWFLQKRHAARYASLQPPKPTNPSHDLEEIAVKPILKALDQQALQDPDRFSLYTSIPEDSRFELVRSILWADAQNYTSPDEFISRQVYFFTPPTTSNLASTQYRLILHQLPPEINSEVPSSTFLPLLQTLHDISDQDWSKAELKSRIASIIDQGSAGTIEEIKKANELPDGMELESAVKKAWVKMVHGYIRWAIMAGMHGPDGSETMRILGRSESLRRLETAGDLLQSTNEDEGGQIQEAKL